MEKRKSFSVILAVIRNDKLMRDIDCFHRKKITSSMEVNVGEAKVTLLASKKLVTSYGNFPLILEGEYSLIVFMAISNSSLISD